MVNRGQVPGFPPGFPRPRFSPQVRIKRFIFRATVAGGERGAGCEAHEQHSHQNGADCCGELPRFHITPPILFSA
jgi:hypothetical protein